MDQIDSVYPVVVYNDAAIVVVAAIVVAAVVVAAVVVAAIVVAGDEPVVAAPSSMVVDVVELFPGRRCCAGQNMLEPIAQFCRAKAVCRLPRVEK